MWGVIIWAVIVGGILVGTHLLCSRAEAASRREWATLSDDEKRARAVGVPPKEDGSFQTVEEYLGKPARGETCPIE